MQPHLGRLTEREKQTLRLLVRGHDAKSIARSLDLSVHTINERLRDARRKLGVSSSREAARMLASEELTSPEKLGDEPLGVATTDAGRPIRKAAEHRLLWLSGGMFVMAVVTAVLALALVAGRMQPERTDAVRAGADMPAHRAQDPAALQAAREWLGLIDARAWDASWRATSAFFRSKVTADAWAQMAQRASAPLGPASSRRVLSDIATDRLPDAPAGEYEVIQFDTDFAHKPGAVETVVLTHEAGGWRVSGYFIR